MTIETRQLDRIQSIYKAAVEEWVSAIRVEEALASVNHNVADIDKWEASAAQEEKARGKAKDAKRAYEDALRQEFFHF
jgi:hypothetical protein